LKNSIGIWLNILALIVCLGFITSCSALIPKKIITPRIKALELKESGASADEVAQMLTSVFGLNKADELALILKDVGFSVLQIADMLERVFNISPSAKGDVLKDIGFTSEEYAQALKVDGLAASQISDKLENVFNVDLEDRFKILKNTGFTDEELFFLKSKILAVKFAPLLKFDKAADTFPMDAEKWFDEMLCGKKGGPSPINFSKLFPNPKVRNSVLKKLSADYHYDYLSCKKRPKGLDNRRPISNLWEGTTKCSTLKDKSYQIPTYYKVKGCGSYGQMRIEYWWFYGYQPDADMGCGQNHPADWEHIMVTTTEDNQKIAAITYYQHSGWYTRIYGSHPPGWGTVEGHPVVYVGKTAHGSYHDDGGSGSCLYYEDFRNPSHNSLWRTWKTPLINLDENEQKWLKYDRTAKWSWGYSNETWYHPQIGMKFYVKTHVGTHPTVSSRNMCKIKACEGKNPFVTAGCLYGKSECKTGHCWCGDSRCAPNCWSCVAWKEYQKDYFIPVNDIGIFWRRMNTFEEGFERMIDNLKNLGSF
jgi:hypothetical protein